VPAQPLENLKTANPLSRLKRWAQPASTGPARLQVLDLLRAIAVFLVLGRHMIPFPADYPQPIRFITDHWIIGGWIGVDLFFVLSGFLISGLLFKEFTTHGHIDFRRFFIRRGFKIYPAFYIFILITILGVYLTHFGPQLSGIWSELFFYQSYQRGLWPQTLSLAVEEHFYLILPLLLIALYKLRQRVVNPFSILPKLFLISALVILAFRFLTAYVYAFDEVRNLYATHLRIDSLFFGAILSYYYHFERERFLSFFGRYWKQLAVLALVLLLPTFFIELDQHVFMYTIGYTAFYVAFGIVVGLAVTYGSLIPKILGRLLRPIYFIGTRSYSIYLWHFPFKLWGLWVIQKVLARELDPLTLFAVYIFGSLLLGIAMASVVELPALRLREKLFPSSPIRHTPPAVVESLPLVPDVSTGP